MGRINVPRMGEEIEYVDNPPSHSDRVASVPMFFSMFAGIGATLFTDDFGILAALAVIGAGMVLSLVFWSTLKQL